MARMILNPTTITQKFCLSLLLSSKNSLYYPKFAGLFIKRTAKTMSPIHRRIPRIIPNICAIPYMNAKAIETVRWYCMKSKTERPHYFITLEARLFFYFLSTTSSFLLAKKKRIPPIMKGSRAITKLMEKFAKKKPLYPIV